MVKTVRLEDIAKDFNLPYEAVLSEMAELLKEYQSRKRGKYLLFRESHGLIFIIDDADVQFIIDGVGKLSFIDLVNRFQLKSSPEMVGWILNELYDRRIIDEEAFKYYTEVKEKPSIKVWIEPTEVKIGEEATLNIEVSTIAEIDKPKISIYQPTAVKLTNEPRHSPSKIFKGSTLFKYSYQAERHGTYRFDVHLEGLLRGVQPISETVSIELMVKPLAPEITIDVKLPKVFAYYDMECNVDFVISNKGKGDAKNVEIKGFEYYPEFLVLSETHVGKIAANSKLIFSLKMKPKKSGVYRFNKLTLSYEDLLGEKFECTVPEFEINVSTLKPRIRVDLIPPQKVRSNQRFELIIRISNIGEGKAKNIKFELPIASEFIVGGFKELSVDLDVNQSEEYILELRAPQKGEIRIDDFSLEFEDMEGNKFIQECGGILISVLETEVPIFKEQLPWPFVKGNYIGGRFKIIRDVGEGEFAKVFLAEDTFRKRNVALKALKPEYVLDLSIFDDFIKEANIAMDLREDHVVSVYSVEKEEVAGREYPYIVMEYMEGGSLADMVLAGRLINFVDAIHIIHDVSRALDYAHNQKGIIHCDISPSNIFFDKEKGLWKLGDFGLARMKLRSERTYERKGGWYVAPEVKNGQEPSEKSDVYSLGVIFLELLTGDRYPSSLGRLEKMRIGTSQGTLRAVKSLIEKMIDPDPFNRPTIKEVLNDIRRVTLRTGLRF